MHVLKVRYDDRYMGEIRVDSVPPPSDVYGKTCSMYGTPPGNAIVFLEEGAGRGWVYASLGDPNHYFGEMIAKITSA